MSDEGGVLGNLPKSRPGRRSDKRAGAGERPPGESRATERRTTASRASGRAARPTRPRATASPPPAAAPIQGEDGQDLVADALRAAGAVVETGLKVASRVASGALGRLPRR